MYVVIIVLNPYFCCTCICNKITNNTCSTHINQQKFGFPNDIAQFMLWFSLPRHPTSSNDRLYYSTRKWLLSLHVQAVNREGNLFLTYTVLQLLFFPIHVSLRSLTIITGADYSLKEILSTSCVICSCPKLLSISVLAFIKWRLTPSYAAKDTIVWQKRPTTIVIVIIVLDDKNSNLFIWSSMWTRL